jgi:prolyl oligopeptidase
VPARAAIRARLGERWDYPRLGIPFERGGRWFQTRNPGLQNQPVLYVMDAPDDEGRPLLDPNVLCADGTVAVSAVSVSPDGSQVAYATSESGSDWLTWQVRDVASAADLADVLEWSRDSGAEWDPGSSGFYYAVMTPPQPGREYPDTGQKRIFFHRAGTSQHEDELVFAADDAALYPDVTATPDGRYLVLSLSHGIGPGAELRVLDLDHRDAGWRVLVPACDAMTVVVASEDGTFYVLTDDDADRRRSSPSTWPIPAVRAGATWSLRLATHCWKPISSAAASSATTCVMPARCCGYSSSMALSCATSRCRA